jgi:hypothetical protein
MWPGVQVLTRASKKEGIDHNAILQPVFTRTGQEGITGAD